MNPANVERVLAMIRPGDVVLDIGGWGCPFNRATHVLDAFPYETRGGYATWGGPASQGGNVEHFTSATWIRRDICEKTPYPFADKSVDFVICSHTLEDVRDPLYVCAEMVRIGKRGYIEVPSREWETCRGHEYARIVGLSHHRWLIELDGTHLRFLQKYHQIHAHWRFSFPKSHLERMPTDRAFLALFWDGSFTWSEDFSNEHDHIGRSTELAAYVQRVRPYSRLRLAGSKAVRESTSLASRLVHKIRREGLRRVTPRD